jgi:lysophospholipase L1-like esterase
MSKTFEQLKPVISALNGRLNDLKSEFTALDNLLVEDTYSEVPLTFDISGYYKNGNLSVLETSIADSKTCIISVTEGDKYKVTGKSSFNQKLVCVYDSSDNILLTIMPENNEQTLTDYEFTIPTGGVKMALSMLHSYVTYLVTLQKAEIAVKKLTTDNVDFFGAVNPVNLYDYQSTVDGEYMNPDGTTTTRADLCYAYIPVDSGTYTLHVCANFFGRTVASRIPMFDAGKNYLNYVTGTYITDGTGITNLEELTITVGNGVKYIGLTTRIAFKNAVMVVSGNSMPTEYVPYVASYSALDDTQKVKAVNVKGGDINPLYAKVVAFDGDSICHGTSAQDGKSGWAGRIGNANSMNWKNYGISGGTITTLASHSVLSSIDYIYGHMPMLDYYIFEGGTNDADRLGLNGIGTVTENDYGGTYDTSTFSGALETLIYKALMYYPTTKIGYIVAQKMGKTNNANYANRKAFFDRAMEICKKWGIPYINLWDGSHLNPNLSSMYDDSLDVSGNIDAKKLYVDGQHLTPTGYDVITPIIEAWMKTL